MWWPPAGAAFAARPRLAAAELARRECAPSSRACSARRSWQGRPSPRRRSPPSTTTTMRNRKRLGMASPTAGLPRSRPESGRAKATVAPAILDKCGARRQATLPRPRRALTGRPESGSYLALDRCRVPRGAPCNRPGPPGNAAEPIETRVARLLAGRTLVMVGMMGAGKSSIGRRLANRLGMPFVDADSEIEHAANASIPEIFEQHGEAYFRDGERRVIQRLLDGSAEGAGDRRRRLHPAGDPRRHPGERHLDLAEGRPRPAPVARQAPLQPAAPQERRSRPRSSTG